MHNMWRQQFWDNFEEGGTQVYFVHLILILVVVIGVEMLAGVSAAVQIIRLLLSSSSEGNVILRVPCQNTAEALPKHSPDTTNTFQTDPRSLSSSSRS